MARAGCLASPSMDEQRMPPPTATELLRLVEARIITVDEARQFLFGHKSHTRLPFPDDHLRRSHGTHAAGRMVL
jgi:hypothetical protein